MIMYDYLTHTGATVLASFMASLVECVEALTIVLAVGVVRGWRAALTGAAIALMVLFLMVAVFGQSLSLVPLPVVQILVGTLLLLFGLRWLHKAILRAAGIIQLHDEMAIFSEETALLKIHTQHHGKWDKLAFMTAFKIVMLEGVEVVFIVIAIGAGGPLMMPASVGAIAALFVVILLGLCLHRPLGNIPENKLKLGVGILLSAFGTFWIGESLHMAWPGENWAILALIFLYFVVVQGLIISCRGKKLNHKKQIALSIIPTIVLRQLVKLFVDDGRFALNVVLWVIIYAVVYTHPQCYLCHNIWLASSVLFLGFAGLLVNSVVHNVSKQ